MCLGERAGDQDPGQVLPVGPGGADVVSGAGALGGVRGRVGRGGAVRQGGSRRGGPPMLTRPIRPSWTAQPTMAQSIARWVNFWNDQAPAAAGLGTRISVSISSGSSAVSN